jgi:hypothetical protein
VHHRRSGRGDHPWRGQGRSLDEMATTKAPASRTGEPLDGSANSSSQAGMPPEYIDWLDAGAGELAKDSCGVLLVWCQQGIAETRKEFGQLENAPATLRRA